MKTVIAIDTITGKPNRTPARMLKDAAASVRKTNQRIAATIHEPIPFVIKKLTEVNHIIQIPNPNTPPKSVRKNPRSSATETYRKSEDPTMYIMKGSMNILAKIKATMTAIREIIPTITATQTKNKKKASTMKANPPVIMKGSAIMKNGAKFHKYCRGKVAM